MPGRRTLAWLVVAAVLALGARPVSHAAEPVPEAAALLQWIRDLTDPSTDGRAAGTPGADRATTYLVGQFQRLELRPAATRAVSSSASRC